jgi:hypothetical protein
VSRAIPTSPEFASTKEELREETLELVIDRRRSLDYGLRQGGLSSISLGRPYVRLTGELKREAQRLTAVTTARSVPGVKAVMTNDLRLETSTDQ